jgi:GDPmannose 4,6-dehydratase
MLTNIKNLKISKKSILIFGITGQDGSLLAKEYLNKNFKVFGVITSKFFSPINLEKLNILKKVKLFHCANIDKLDIRFLIRKTQCSTIFLLSGISSVKKSETYKHETILSNNLILIEVLEFVRVNNLIDIKIFNASSGEIFGDNKGLNDEDSALNPLSYYALAKSISLEISRSYRVQFKLKVYNGILFNHESHLRPETYVIKKIITGANDISNKKIKKLTLGNTNVYRDWGWAPEYVKIIYKIISKTKPDDYIIATGKTTKLDHLVTKIFNHYKLKKIDYLEKSHSLKRILEPIRIDANVKKLRKKIKYIPKISISDIILMMIEKKK